MCKTLYSLLATLLRLSIGLKWMVGMGQTSCMGSASTRQEAFLSQPAPSRYSPCISTPSWRRGGEQEVECKTKSLRESMRESTVQEFNCQSIHTYMSILLFSVFMTVLKYLNKNLKLFDIKALLCPQYLKLPPNNVYPIIQYFRDWHELKRCTIIIKITN